MNIRDIVKVSFFLILACGCGEKSIINNSASNEIKSEVNGKCPINPKLTPNWNLDRFLSEIGKREDSETNSVLYLEYGSVKIRYFWYERNSSTKKCVYARVVAYKKHEHTIKYFSNDHLEIGNNMETKFYDENEDDYKIGHIPYGRAYEFYPNGGLKKKLCYSVHHVKPCGKITNYDESGNISSEEDTGLNCELGCGEFIPIRFPGAYIVKEDSVSLQKEPRFLSHTIMKLSINEKVRVLKDSGLIQEKTPDIASWVLVETSDGKKGYVFGVFLKSEDEYWR